MTDQGYRSESRQAYDAGHQRFCVRVTHPNSLYPCDCGLQDTLSENVVKKTPGPDQVRRFWAREIIGGDLPGGDRPTGSTVSVVLAHDHDEIVAQLLRRLEEGAILREVLLRRLRNEELQP